MAFSCATYLLYLFPASSFFISVLLKLFFVISCLLFFLFSPVHIFIFLLVLYHSEDIYEVAYISGFFKKKS